MRIEASSLHVTSSLPSGEKQAARVYAELVGVGASVETVRARVTEEKADAFDHLAAGFTPDQAEPFMLQLFSEQEHRAQSTQSDYPQNPLNPHAAQDATAPAEIALSVPGLAG